MDEIAACGVVLFALYTWYVARKWDRKPRPGRDYDERGLY